MKRKKELETLSWEHHNGLVVAFRLQQGLQKGSRPEIMRDYILSVWNNELKKHFWQEEQSLPDLLKRKAQGNELAGKMLEDHTRFARIIEKLQQGKDMQKSVQNFAELLNQHIRFEERKVFPFIESQCTGEQLMEISTFLHEHHETAEKSWPVEFWKD